MTVYLVGAGPGDPGLLTRRGAALLAMADVVVHDRLIDPSLLELAPAGVELIDVGKRPGAGQAEPGHAATAAVVGGAQRQSEINALLIERGRRGQTVVRLKGGDPFLFGRGGEEAEALDRAGVRWEVVPGVTSAIAVPAYVGVPVTHRGVSTSVTVVTGHVGDPTAPGGVDWESLARAGGTIVILMGMARRAEIACGLRAGGRSDDTPVAIIEWGTTGAQRSLRTTLGGLADASMGSPSVIVVGAVAGLTLGAARPLAGRSVVLTRPPAQAEDLASALVAVWARVVRLPTIRIAEPEGPAADQVAAAAAAVGDYDWVVFTSANAVDRFVSYLRDGRAFGRARLAAVGPATAAALARHALVADLVPDQRDAEGLVAALPDPPLSGRVLFPRAEGAREVVPEELAARGWRVDEVVTYRTVPADPPDATLAAEVTSADAVVFASPSAVEAFAAMADPSGVPLVMPAVVVCTGPATARAAARVTGGPVVTTAGPTPGDLLGALEGALSAVRSPDVPR